MVQFYMKCWLLYWPVLSCKSTPKQFPRNHNWLMKAIKSWSWTSIRGLSVSPSFIFPFCHILSSFFLLLWENLNCHCGHQEVSEQLWQTYECVNMKANIYIHFLFICFIYQLQRSLLIFGWHTVYFGHALLPWKPLLPFPVSLLYGEKKRN